MHKIYLIIAVLLVVAFVIRDTNPQFVRDFRHALKQYIGDYQEVGDVYENYHNKNQKPYSPPYPNSNIRI